MDDDLTMDEHDDGIADELTPAQRMSGVAPVRVQQELGPWNVEWRWPKDGAQSGPWALTIRPSRDATEEEIAGGISTTLLRHLNLAGASEKWRGKREAHDEHALKLDKRRAEKLKLLLYQGLSDEYLAEISRVYVSLVMRGEKSITKTIAELIGKSPDTAKMHLREARKRDLLTTVTGRAGGHLTPKARQILALDRPTP